MVEYNYEMKEKILKKMLIFLLFIFAYMCSPLCIHIKHFTFQTYINYCVLQVNRNCRM